MVVGPSRAVSVVVGSSYELLVRLYRHIQAVYGLPAAELGVGLAVPPELGQDVDLFFRGDIALGMNVIPVAHANGWHDVTALVAGLDATDPTELAVAMLRPPDATPAGCRRRDRAVAAVLAGSRSRAALLDALEAERFDPSAADQLLDEPVGAVRAFTRLVRRCVPVVNAHKDALVSPLTDHAERVRRLLAETSLNDVAAQLFPQWHFRDLAAFASVVLIPSQAIAPFLSTRLVSGDKAVIVFPVTPDTHTTLESVVAGLKTIAHPQRLQILRLAGAAPVTGQELARVLGLTEATVHHHTSLLRFAGLLTSHREVHRVYHTARPDVLARLLDAARHAVTLPRAPADAIEAPER